MRQSHLKTGYFLGATLALACACLMWLAASPATAGWSAPAVVSGAGSSTSQTRVAGASDGSSWVVWKRAVGGFDVIQGTRVAIDGTQGPVQTLSPLGTNATDPVVESRADGSAMVAWLNTSAADHTVVSRAIATDGTLGPPTTRSAAGPAGQPAKGVAIALGADGTAALSWLKFNGTNWVVQAVKVVADGSAGTIHDLSDPAVDAGLPDLASIPAPTPGVPNNYRVFWPYGTGANSNVGTRDINSDDTITDRVGIFRTGTECLYPFDVNVVNAGDGAVSAFWICFRSNLDRATAQPFFNWSVQWLRMPQGSTVVPGLNVVNASPSAFGTTYKINRVEVGETFGGEPVAVWSHELASGEERLETWRIQPDGSGQGWVNPRVEGSSVESLAIAGNASNAAIAGGVVPGLLPGQSTVSWARFSLSSLDPVTPSGGGILYTADPGYAMADNGKTLAAFTAIDGASVGTVRVMTYTDPGIALNSGNLNFGKRYIGRTAKASISVRSSGETPNEVTGISLAGPGAGSYQLTGASQCLREMLPGSNCRFEVAFRPGSVATQNATLTVTSEAGNRMTSLTGSGLNRTRNRITANKRNFAARKGRSVKVRVRVRNLGGVTSNSTRVCVRLRKRALKLAGKRCRSLGSFAAGADRRLGFRIKLRRRARRGVRLPVTFRMRADNALDRQVVVRVRRKGR